MLVFAATDARMLQRQTLRWQSFGGPPMGATDIIEQNNGVLLLAEGSWVSHDGSRSWSRLSPQAQLGWKRTWNAVDLFIDGPKGVERTSDFGETTVRCGTLPVDRATGNDVDLVSDSDHVFAFIRNRGLYRSDDRCASWGAVAVPSLDRVFRLFAGEGYVVLSGYPSYLSRDLGATWLDIRAAAKVDPIVVSGGCRGRLLMGTFEGPMQSTDGRIWTPLGLEGRDVREIVESPCGTLTAVVDDSLPRQQAIMRSTNAGASWTSLKAPFNGHSVAALRVARDGAVYVAGAAGTFRISPRDEYEPIGPPSSVTGLVAAASGRLVAVTAGLSAFEGTPGEERQTERWGRFLIAYTVRGRAELSGFAAQPRAVAVTAGGNLLLNMQPGVVQSTDGGVTWRLTLERYAQTFASLADGAVFAGTQDGIFRSLDGGATWIERSLGLTSFNIVVLGSGGGTTIYAVTNSGEIYRSLDQGDRWRPMGPNPAGRVSVLFTTRAGRLFAGTSEGLLALDDVAERWTKVPLSANSAGGAVTAMLESRQGRLYVATRGGIFVSTDDGGSWNSEPTPGAVASVLVEDDASARVFAPTEAGVWMAETR